MSNEPANEFDEADDPNVHAPGTGEYPLVVRRRPPPWLHMADTRRVLAVVIVAVTILLYAYLVVAVVDDWITGDEFVKLLAALAPLQSLAAVTVGFFFARQGGDR